MIMLDLNNLNYILPSAMNDSISILMKPIKIAVLGGGLSGLCFSHGLAKLAYGKMN